MKPRTTVHLVRHGQVENPDGILYGRLPGYHLSATGRAMAERLGEYFADRDVLHVVASPLLRAQETAAPIGAALELPVASDQRLIEAGNSFEGEMFSISRLRDPRVWSRLRNPLRPSWGEPYTEIVHRMRAATQAARDAATGHEAVCVSHQLPVWSMRRYAEGKRLWHDPRSRRCALASVTSLTFEGDDIVALDYNEPYGPVEQPVPGSGTTGEAVG